MNPAESNASRDQAVEELRREADRLDNGAVNSAMTVDAERLWMGQPRRERALELRARADLVEAGDY